MTTTYRLIKEYVTNILGNLDEFKVDHKKKIRLHLNGEYEIDTPKYLYAYYQTFWDIRKVKPEIPSFTDAVVDMFNARKIFLSYQLL